MRENRAILDDSHALRPARETHCLARSGGHRHLPHGPVAGGGAARGARKRSTLPSPRTACPQESAPPPSWAASETFRPSCSAPGRRRSCAGGLPKTSLIWWSSTAWPSRPSEPRSTRIFVVTTYGATVEAGGASTNANDAQHTLAELTALSAQVVAGKRTLRDALATSAK